MTENPDSPLSRPKDTAFPVVVGTADWQNPGWWGTYYPPDLPPEWRLAFYANDFSGVLIPATTWRSTDPSRVEKWRQDTPEDFAIFLETEEDGDTAIPSIAGLLGERLAGVVTMSQSPRPGHLQGVDMAEALRGAGQVVMLSPAELEEKRKLGRDLLALAARAEPVRALFVTGAVDASAVQELRLLAELTGLA